MTVYFGFGLVVLGMLLVVTPLLALPLTLLLYYAFVLRKPSQGRKGLDMGLFTLANVLSSALMLFVLLAGMEGNAGSGVKFWGVDVFGGVWPWLVVIVLSALIQTAGKLRLKQVLSELEEEPEESELL